jgi:hypothetical protein
MIPQTWTNQTSTLSRFLEGINIPPPLLVGVMMIPPRGGREGPDRGEAPESSYHNGLVEQPLQGGWRQFIFL